MRRSIEADLRQLRKSKTKKSNTIKALNKITRNEFCKLVGPDSPIALFLQNSESLSEKYRFESITLLHFYFCDDNNRQVEYRMLHRICVNDTEVSIRHGDWQEVNSHNRFSILFPQNRFLDLNNLSIATSQKILTLTMCDSSDMHDGACSRHDSSKNAIQQFAFDEMQKRSTNIIHFALYIVVNLVCTSNSGIEKMYDVLDYFAGPSTKDKIFTDLTIYSMDKHTAKRIVDEYLPALLKEITL